MKPVDAVVDGIWIRCDIPWSTVAQLTDERLRDMMRRRAQDFARMSRKDIREFANAQHDAERKSDDTR
jgi:hypothetical protein